MSALWMWGVLIGCVSLGEYVGWYQGQQVRAGGIASDSPAAYLVSDGREATRAILAPARGGNVGHVGGIVKRVLGGGVDAGSGGYVSWSRRMEASAPLLSAWGGGVSTARSQSEASEVNPRRSVGTVFRDCAECPQMVVIPTGSFKMGSLEGKGEDVETPLHPVKIDYRLAVGVYEVTFTEWEACVAAGGCGGYVPPERWGGRDRPVINVSWEDAMSYVSWLSKRTGASYRLLSESEWEYAARAGTTTEYSWGDSVGVNNANCNGCGSRWDDRKTAPVGWFPANAWGLHDMHGNVLEWVQDCWNDHYLRAPADGSAWLRGQCRKRVLRGGSWQWGPRGLRSARRVSFTSDYRSSDWRHFGFRVARTVTP